MGYGLSKGLPKQDDEVCRRLALRWLRAVEPHNEWAKTAKRCTEMLEGLHWTPEEKAELRAMKRSALTINKMNSLYRLVIGYQSSNRMDVSFMPTSDAVSNEGVGQVITALNKIESDRIDLRYTDTGVFSDGITTGRGFWDTRLCFKENDFGEIAVKSDDPFSIYVDPDADTYDLNNSAAYITESVWTDLDHIGGEYGLAAMDAAENLLAPTNNSSLLSYLGESEVSPKRFFGGYADDKAFGNWSDVYFNDFVDTQAKRIRLMDTQYKIKTIAPCFIDLETGVRQMIPEDWLKPEGQHKIEAALAHAEQLRNPLKIANRPVERIRWTVTCADLILFDGWSPYNTYTKTGFFPYFRRGKTRGMMEDLIDPQMELNKKRSVRVDILNRNANAGWKYEEGTLDPEQEENLRRSGSAPGIMVKWKRSAANPNAEGPVRIEPGGYPQGLDRLEEQSAMDLHEISGINESALGQLDKVQSGRAIEARQRQAVLAIQPYQDNFTRSKKLQGRKSLEIYQQHYTEERVYRTIGEDSKLVQYEINKKMMTGSNGVTRMNDITVGRYSVVVDETPISASFKQAQFEEMMALLEKLGPLGMAIAQTSPHLIIDMTSMPQKDEWKRGLMQATAMVPPGGAGPGGAGGTPMLPPPGAPGQTPEAMSS